MLAVALGLAMLAGVNLYLTTFLTGIAVSLGKVTDADLAGALEGFGHPAVVGVALGLLVLQFIIDKVPWVDSLWDSIHTFIKPAGGALLALTSLGPDASPFTSALIGLLALAASLLTHWIKTGTRLSINTSPEPFSNIAASLTEDLLVVGGALLLLHHPPIALPVFAAALALFIYLSPRVTRSICATLWLIWKKVRVPASNQKPSSTTTDLPNKLSSAAEALLLDEFGSESYQVEWCARCVTGKMSGSQTICSNLFGTVIAIHERPQKLFFFGKRHLKPILEQLDLADAEASQESLFLSEGIAIGSGERKFHLRFHRGQAELVEQLVDFLQEKKAKPSATLPELDPAETEEKDGDGSN